MRHPLSACASETYGRVVPDAIPIKIKNEWSTTVKLNMKARAVLFATAICLMSISAVPHDGGSVPNLTAVSTAVPVAAVNSPAAEGCPIESPDGLSLLFASTRPGGVAGNVGNDIWLSDRDTLASPWQPPKNLGEPVNSAASDFCPTPVWGRWLFFVSERLDNGTDTPPCGGGDMYLSRQSPAGDWSPPAMLACAPEGPNFSGPERSPSLVQTWFGTFLFYSSNGGSGGQDIYMSCMRADGTFGPGEVVKELSTEFDDIMPNVRERNNATTVASRSCSARTAQRGASTSLRRAVRTCTSRTRGGLPGGRHRKIWAMRTTRLA